MKSKSRKPKSKGGQDRSCPYNSRKQGEVISHEPKFAKWGRQAEQMYVELGQSLTEISEHIPVSLNTLRKWRIKGDWETRRKVYYRSNWQVVQDLQAEIPKVVSAMQKSQASDPTLADKLVKILSAIEKLDKRSLFPSFALRFSSDYTEFLRVEHPKKLPEWNAMFQEFMKRTWIKYRSLT